jgi:NAD(P)-dependent dehydrogenase (short-subunit alcohol dehydrogenase family)
MKEVVVVTGLGSMGLACARRLGSGRCLVITDVDARRTDDAAASLRDDGFDVVALALDLGDTAAPHELVTAVATAGQLRALVHTAAISQAQAPTAERIYAVNLVGTARMIEAFQPIANPGTVGVIIASMGAQFVQIAPEVERALALAPVDELLAATRRVPGHDDKSNAYLVAKRGNQLRVERESLAWAARGARLVSISPGLVSTAQGRLELREHPQVAAVLAGTPMRRIGTPDDIAGIVEWVTGRAASFVTGTDLRIDGGTIAALHWGQLGKQLAGSGNAR